MDSECDRYGFSKSDVQIGLEGCGIPVYVGTGSNSGKLLGLFGKDVVAKGYAIGVVSDDGTVLYDLSDKCATFRDAGSVMAWDIKEYDSVSGIKSSSSYVSLEKGGIDLLADAILTGKYYVYQKRRDFDEGQPYIHATTNYTYTELVTFTNSTSSDPYFRSLRSILKFEYPKVVTEGDCAVYKLTRGGVLSDALTVHMFTNGHWCANLAWAGGEGGTKAVAVKTGIEDGFDNNRPFEVVLKMLNGNMAVAR